jgi:hypothetical protein
MTLFYPDISSAQAGMDLAGALAVAVKATEGTSYVNPDYARAKANATTHGTYFTAYHFLHAGGGSAQAAHAHQVAGRTPLMIDVEAEGASRPGTADVVEFIDAYRKAGGVTHLCYLPHWYWQSIGSPSLKPLADRGMVLVSSAYTTYTDAAGGTGWQGYGGMTPQVWQYTDRLHLNGHDVDFNAFRGSHGGDQSGAAVAATLAEFRSVAETGKMPATPPPPAPAGPAHPVARSASGKESLRHAVHREGTPVQRALWLMARDPDRDKFGDLQRAYLGAGNWDAIMPRGMVYWVG